MRIRRALAALAVPPLAAAVLAVPSPAAAAGSAAAPCMPARDHIAGWNYTTTCSYKLWDHIYYVVGKGGCKNLPGGTSYVYNNSGQSWLAWTGSNCSGAAGPLHAWMGGPMNGDFDGFLSMSRDM